MPNRLPALIGVLVTAIAFASPATQGPSTAATQAQWSARLTPWGDPDLRGLWEYATMTPLERAPELGEKAVFTEEEAAAYERQVLERQKVGFNTGGPDWWDTVHLAKRRTSLVVDPADGRIPPLTPEAQARAAALAKFRLDHPDSVKDFSLSVRCLLWPTAGPPMLPGLYNNNVRIFQTRQHVAIFNEMIHDVRVVPIDGRPRRTIRQWRGEPRGRWEDTTLVVETLNFSDKSSFRGSDENLRLVERFTRVDQDTIQYQFTVEDPTVWTRPWTVVLPMRATTVEVFEFACHEGNARSLEGILSAARAAKR
jgi:hypothetical protein